MAKGIIRFVVFLLILEGMRSLWNFTEVCLYGYSQQSIVDAIANIALTSWLDKAIWERWK